MAVASRRITVENSVDAAIAIAPYSTETVVIEGNISQPSYESN